MATETQQMVVVIDDEPPIVDVVCDALDLEGIAAVACDYGQMARLMCS